MPGMKKGKIFFISGPSGVGKGTIISALREKYKDEFVFPPSCTTRDPRPGEIDGETYYFITKEEFKERIEAGEFLEYAHVHNGNMYGTLKHRLLDPVKDGKVVIREFDVQGFTQAREKLDPEMYTSMFLMPDGPLEILIERITARSPLSDEEVEQRRASMEKELAKAEIYDYQVIIENNKIEKNIAKIEKIIEDELN